MRFKILKRICLLSLHEYIYSYTFFKVVIGGPRCENAAFFFVFRG